MCGPNCAPGRLEELAGRCQRIATQIQQRLRGEKITDRLVSLSDPDARSIRKGKLGKPNEFGYVAQLAEVTANTDLRLPLGHTAAAICLYGALAALAAERARSALVRWLTLTLAVLIPLAVAVARVYRGMHYLTDVVGGILLGGAWLAATVQGIRLGVAHWQLRHRTALRL